MTTPVIALCSCCRRPKAAGPFRHGSPFGLAGRCCHPCYQRLWMRRSRGQPVAAHLLRLPPKAVRDESRQAGGQEP
jgi:hypothetical protein